MPKFNKQYLKLQLRPALVNYNAIYQNSSNGIDMTKNTLKIKIHNWKVDETPRTLRCKKLVVICT